MNEIKLERVGITDTEHRFVVLEYLYLHAISVITTCWFYELADKDKSITIWMSFEFTIINIHIHVCIVHHYFYVSFNVCIVHHYLQLLIYMYMYV